MTGPARTTEGPLTSTIARAPRPIGQAAGWRAGWLGRVALLLAFCMAAPGALPARQASAPADELQVGVIRWDNWYPESKHNKILVATPDRLPFFAKGVGDQVVLLGGTRPAMIAENAYARAAGIDYWLFSYFAPTGSFGRDAAHMDKLNRALKAYRSLPDRGGLRYAVILQQTYPASDFDKLVAMLVPLLADRDYLPTAAGGVPLYVWLPRWEETLGGSAKVQAFFVRLRDALSHRLNRPVRMIAITQNLERARTHVGPGKAFSALTTYAHAPPNDGRVLSASQCAEIGAKFWKGALALGVDYIPNATLGWDPRPILAFPDQLYDRPKMFGACERGEFDAWRAQIAAARSVAQAGAVDREPPGLLLYAWNEFAEGGWLAPSRSEGTRRIAALSSALGRTGPLPRVDLLFPAGDPGSPAGWPCPPRMRIVSDKPATPDAEMRALHAGRWTQRTCSSVR